MDVKFAKRFPRNQINLRALLAYEKASNVELAFSVVQPQLRSESLVTDSVVARYPNVNPVLMGANAMDCRKPHT
jgi:hypothetical protein